MEDEWRYWREARPEDYAAGINTGTWVTVVVPVYRACWRHDFNWRNLSRIEHFVDSSVDSWNDQAKDEADALFEVDLRQICDEVLVGALWADALVKCYSNAAAYEFGVSNVTHFLDVTPSPDIGPPERVR